ncbi:hypothetical protein ACFSVK_23685 [Azorhizophilus paspali]|uniref:hypothetical protein n=1 Tax=Azorhizophilus paspali TaxID=69963 RepID=UPI00363D2079
MKKRIKQNAPELFSKHLLLAGRELVFPRCDMEAMPANPLTVTMAGVAVGTIPAKY